jgi:hypothetical protein
MIVWFNSCFQMFCYKRISELMLRVFLVHGEQQHLDEISLVQTLTVHILNLLGGHIDNSYKRLLGQLGAIEVRIIRCILLVL